jgi:hypothetical protein
MRKGAWCIVVKLGLTYLLGLAASALSAVPSKVLQIPWPAQWEIRQPTRQDFALQLHAREYSGGSTLQLLDLTAVNIRSASKDVDLLSLRELALQLRDYAARSAAEEKIELTPFDVALGYYFIATDRNYRGADGEYRQMVEGVMLKSGYLINFTLLTNDANSAESRNMMSALSELQIE